ncbi:MAG: twin-arginine translocation signal domain-containing protein [Prevotellaceae bacterium]|jgi:hypothetical protein|nr:twin-arginine translocation signal domain-containing protein [Prevotellaceae bacterium]
MATRRDFLKKSGLGIVALTVLLQSKFDFEKRNIGNIIN